MAILRLGWFKGDLDLVCYTLPQTREDLLCVGYSVLLEGWQQRQQGSRCISWYYEPVQVSNTLTLKVGLEMLQALTDPHPLTTV